MSHLKNAFRPYVILGLGFLLPLVMTSCQNGGSSGQTPSLTVPTDQALAGVPEAPKVEIKPDTDVQLRPGASLPLQAIASNPGQMSYEWILVGVGSLSEETDKPAVIYFAPATVTEGVNSAVVSVIVRNKAGGETTKGITISISEPKSESTRVAASTPTVLNTVVPEVGHGTPESTASPVSTRDQPVILSPADGDVVPMHITVSGSVAPLADGMNLHVLVRPEGHNYWVQTEPGIADDGTWSNQTVFVGQPADVGLAFDICAVITDQSLVRGQEIASLPAGPSTCIKVTRGDAEPPSGSAGASSPDAPQITEPAEESQVDSLTAVRGAGADPARAAGRSLYVLVHPHGYTYWVQTLPRVDADGSWVSQPVYVGISSDAGLSFDICAVFTDQQLTRGQEIPALPAGDASCITVVRR